MSPYVVCTTALFAVRDRVGCEEVVVDCARVCSSRVGRSLKMSRSVDL